MTAPAVTLGPVTPLKLERKNHCVSCAVEWTGMTPCWNCGGAGAVGEYRDTNGNPQRWTSGAIVVLHYEPGELDDEAEYL